MPAAAQGQARQGALELEEAGNGPMSGVPADAWELARCRDGAASLLGLFFSDALEDIAKAKAICAVCPLAGACLEGALDRQEPWGVWGGQLFADGRVLAFKRKRGRPRKSEATGPAVEVRLTA